jgi:hypothetical protein
MAISFRWRHSAGWFGYDDVTVLSKISAPPSLPVTLCFMRGMNTGLFNILPGRSLSGFFFGLSFLSACWCCPGVSSTRFTGFCAAIRGCSGSGIFGTAPNGRPSSSLSGIWLSWPVFPSPACSWLWALKNRSLRCDESLPAEVKRNPSRVTAQKSAGSRLQSGLPGYRCR